MPKLLKKYIILSVAKIYYDTTKIFFCDAENYFLKISVLNFAENLFNQGFAIKGNLQKACKTAPEIFFMCL